MLTKLWFKVWSSVAHSFVDPEKRFRNFFHSEQLEKVEFPFRFTISWEIGIKLSRWNKFSWFRFSRFTTSQVSGWASLFSTLLAFLSTAFPRPRPLPRLCARPLPLSTPLPTDLLAKRTRPPRFQCRPRLQTPRTSLPLLALLRTHTWSSPSSPSSSRTSNRSILLRSRPLCRYFQAYHHMEAKWHCHRHRRSLQRRQAVPFRQESPVIPRLPLHPYGFRDKSLREGNSSPLSKNFGKNLNMNIPKRLDHCKEQLNAKLHAQSCRNATNENKVKVPQTTSTVYGRFPHWRTRKG